MLRHSRQTVNSGYGEHWVWRKGKKNGGRDRGRRKEERWVDIKQTAFTTHYDLMASSLYPFLTGSCDPCGFRFGLCEIWTHPGPVPLLIELLTMMEKLDSLAVNVTVHRNRKQSYLQMNIRKCLSLVFCCWSLFYSNNHVCCDTSNVTRMC